MTNPISTHRDGDVLVVVSNNPPVNALGQAVRAGLKDAIEAGLADDGVKAIVIRCDGRTFFAGADITEFGKPPMGPSLPETLDAMEASNKPVVAAIHGTALGGGCEVALACHYRVAVQSAKLGLPEVKLGLIPGAGGTQRLPRLVGAEAALPLVVGGDPIPAKKAQAIGLVDAIVGEDSLETDAVAFARSKIGHPVPRASEGTKNQDGVKNPAIFDEFRHKQARRIRGFDAPNAAIEAVKAAGELPYAEGVKKERELFMKLMTGTQSAAMRHYFFAERAANKIKAAITETLVGENTIKAILDAYNPTGSTAYVNFTTSKETRWQTNGPPPKRFCKTWDSTGHKLPPWATIGPTCRSCNVRPLPVRLRMATPRPKRWHTTSPQSAVAKVQPGHFVMSCWWPAGITHGCWHRSA